MRLTFDYILDKQRTVHCYGNGYQNISDEIINQSVLPIVARKEKDVVTIQGGGDWRKNKQKVKI